MEKRAEHFSVRASIAADRPSELVLELQGDQVAMSPLTEQATKQLPGELRRRWFSSEALDLIVWYDQAERLFGFQLCYDKPDREHALTWRPDAGFLHSAVDDGEGDDRRHKRTPILVADGQFDHGRVGRLFAEASAHLPNDVMAFVSERLRAYESAAS